MCIKFVEHGTVRAHTRTNSTTYIQRWEFVNLVGMRCCAPCCLWVAVDVVKCSISTRQRPVTICKQWNCCWMFITQHLCHWNSTQLYSHIYTLILVASNDVQEMFKLITKHFGVHIFTGDPKAQTAKYSRQFYFNRAIIVNSIFTHRNLIDYTSIFFQGQWQCISLVLRLILQCFPNNFQARLIMWSDIYE